MKRELYDETIRQFGKKAGDGLCQLENLLERINLGVQDSDEAIELFRTHAPCVLKKLRETVEA